SSKGFGHIARIGGVRAYDNDARVMVVHWKSAIVLCAPHLANILSLQNATARNVSRTRQGSGVKSRRIAHVDYDRRSIVSEYMAQSIGLYFGDATKSAPDRHS